MFNDLCWSKLQDVIHDNLQLIVNFINIIVEYFHHRLTQTKLSVWINQMKCQSLLAKIKRITTTKGVPFMPSDFTRF